MASITNLHWSKHLRSIAAADMASITAVHGSTHESQTGPKCAVAAIGAAISAACATLWGSRLVRMYHYRG